MPAAFSPFFARSVRATTPAHIALTKHAGSPLARCLLVVLAICGTAMSGWAINGQLGRAVFWGDNSFRQGSPPANLGPVRELAAGASHSLALRPDGTVVSWGANFLGEATVPAGLNNVIGIGAGVAHSLALKSDGTVVAWGDNTRGQVSVPSGLSGVTAISVGHWHNLALKSDGTVVAWGANALPEAVVPSGLSGVTAIAAGGRHSVALKSDGTVVAWGANVEGETNVPSGLSGVVAIAAGEVHTVVLKSDGTVQAWGDNSEGQINVPLSLSGVVSIAAGFKFTAAVRANGTALAWGDNTFGQSSVPSGIGTLFKLFAGSGHILGMVEIPPAPLITLVGNGVNIARGDTTPSLADHTQFGGTSVINGSLTRTFTIRNDGDLDLNLTGSPSVTITGAHASDFTVVTQPVSPVLVGQSTTFEVKFDPVAAGNRSATVRVTSADVPRSPYTFAIRGTGIIPPGTPTVRLSTPSTARTLSATAPLSVSGSAGDDVALDRVEVVLNNGAPVSATLTPGATPKTVTFAADVTPPPGENTLTVTAFDTSGNPSLPVVRRFIFEQRYLLTLARTVPVAQTATPDRAGTLSLSALPASKATALTRGPAPQTSSILPGTQVRLTTTARSGHLFSHWTGLPAGAVATGNIVNFVMPAQDEPAVTAVFLENPLAGFFGTRSATFRGLLLPDPATPAGIGTAGYLTASLVPGSGALSGKLFLNGRVTAFTASLNANGSIWFKAGRTLLPELSFDGRILAMSWDNSGLSFEVSAAGGLTSSGLARPDLYNAAAPVPPNLLNVSGRSGYYTVTLPAQTQTPVLPLADYPQGSGFATLTLSRSGGMRFVATLADGTKTTISSALVAANTSPVHAQLTTPGLKTKGGSFLGTLIFDDTQPDSDVTAADMLWFRPAVVEGRSAATKPYTAGWPQGIKLGAFGAKYDRFVTLQLGLNLPAEDPVNGNARLTFEMGKLSAAVVKTNFNIIASRTFILPPTDRSFSLVLTQSSGLVRGTLTPNWTDPAARLPAFQGVVLQKGAARGGYGYFMSNRLNDNDPESGLFELMRPVP